MRSLPLQSLPWQIISQDLFESEKNDYLVTVCHFSDWIEVDHFHRQSLSATNLKCSQGHMVFNILDQHPTTLKKMNKLKLL